MISTIQVSLGITGRKYFNFYIGYKSEGVLVKGEVRGGGWCVVLTVARMFARRMLTGGSY